MAKEYIEKRKGAYHLAGTRVSLDSIVHCFREGLSAETIQTEFESLTLAQVYGAIAYYLENQPAVDEYLKLQAQRIEHLRASTPPPPEEVMTRIEAARQQLRHGATRP